MSLFDLHLIMFRSIKDETETKIDSDIKINMFFELGLIKNWSFPFFEFKDNRNLNLKINLDTNTLKDITDNEDPLLCYKKILPRNNIVDFIKKNPV